MGKDLLHAALPDITAFLKFLTLCGESCKLMLSLQLVFFLIRKGFFYAVFGKKYTLKIYTKKSLQALDAVGK